VDVELWEIPCDSHATGILYTPDEYREHLRAFFAQLPGSPEA
jgi:hypothetical protein